MAKKKEAVDDDDGGIVISGFGILTISIKLELHQDEPLFDVPEVIQHKLRTVIPDPGVGISINPDRIMSAGCVFGHEIGRVANHFREALANHEDMAAGFAREMRDWETDHNKGGK